jgi:hypothetical protein
MLTSDESLTGCGKKLPEEASKKRSTSRPNGNGGWIKKIEGAIELAQASVRKVKTNRRRPS